MSNEELIKELREAEEFVIEGETWTLNLFGRARIALESPPTPPAEAVEMPDDVEVIRDDLLLTLITAGYDTSGTDHSSANEIEVGTDDHEFRITIGAL